MTKTLLLILASYVLWNGCAERETTVKKVVLVSANAEWRVVKDIFPGEVMQTSPWGQYFYKELTVGRSTEKIVFFHGGWGKVAAAGSTQFCIDRWNPEYIINLGTCGGFDGLIKKSETILVNKTIVYDIAEAMGDTKQAISDYTTDIVLSWLAEPYPASVIKTLMVSADRDIVPSEIGKLRSEYHAIAGDWETGAIAYTCSRNKVKILILRGVSDVVSESGGAAYQNEPVFVQGTTTVMKYLLRDLPLWLAKCP